MNHTQCVERTIEALANGQFGVFARDQALELGATRRMIDYRVQHGAWTIVLPGVLRAAVVASSLEQRAMAACLWSAPDGLVSHRTAAKLWAFEGITTDRMHVTVPAGRSLRSEKVTVHHTTDLLPADVARRGPIAVTSALRTAIDLAEALMGTGRSGSAALRDLIARRDVGRTESGWEVRTAQVLVTAGFAAPTRQYSVRHHGKEIARVDLAYPDAQVILEYDSDQWHAGTTRRHRDAARRNRLRALGWTVVEVTPETLRQPAELVAIVAALLAA